MCTVKKLKQSFKLKQINSYECNTSLDNCQNPLLVKDDIKIHFFGILIKPEFFFKLYVIKMVLCIFGKTTVNYWQGVLSQWLNPLLKTVESLVSVICKNLDVWQCWRKSQPVLKNGNCQKIGIIFMFCSNSCCTGYRVWATPYWIACVTVLKLSVLTASG